MSLLDDVSIVVTPNGYKSGELYAVVPVPTEGSEVVVNGDFATDTWWLKSSANVNISNGKGNYTGGTTEYFYKPNILTVGKQYKLVFEITDYTTGYISALAGNWSGAQTAVGTYEIYFTCIDDDFGLVGNTFVGSIDNVSVKEYTSADMDVTRATAATRVDENGLVNYAEVLGDSILTGNNSNFDTGIGSWITYIGGSLAHDTDKLEVTLLATGSGARINTNSLISGGQIGKTFKIRAKIWQGTTTATSLNVYLGSVQDVITISSTPTYFEVELTPTSTAYLTIYRGSSSGGTFFIDDVTVKEVTRDNVPRIDYTGGGCPHILAEPQRTNLVTYSEDFSQWSKNANLDLTLNSATAPNGSVTADNITYVGSLGSPDGRNLQVFPYPTGGTASKTFTLSVYVKGTGQFRLKNTHGGVTDNFSNDFTATTNWVRYNFTVSNSSSTGTGSQIVGITAASTDVAFNLDIWGAQLEQGSYPTSYIPTSGSIVTRNQDIFTRDGIGSLINDSEGVLFVEMAALVNSDTTNPNRGISISSDSTNNTIYIYFQSGTNQFSIILISGGTTQFLYSTTSFDVTSFNKVALKYKQNDFALWVNGVEVATDSSGNTPTGLSKLSFDNGAGNDKLFGKVRQLQVYDTALTDNQLIQLTGEAGTHFFESYSEMAETLTYTIQ